MLNPVIPDMVGQTNENIRTHERYALLSCRDPEHVLAVFQEDNSIVETTYDGFKAGTVERKDSITDWVGLPVTDRDGEEAVISVYRNNENVTVKYPDGELVKNLALEDVVNGLFGRGEEKPLHRGVKGDKPRGLMAERQRTYDQAQYLLGRFGKCLVSRPCSWGKSVMGLAFFASDVYAKCLFLHPEDDTSPLERIRSAGLTDKVDSMSYSRLSRLSDAAIKSLDYDFVFLDEAHRIGGDDDGEAGAWHTYRAVKKLMKWHPETDFLGATATPVRPDGFSIAHDVFDDRVCYPYGLQDAIRDGYITAPHYAYYVYDIDMKVREVIGQEFAKTRMTVSRQRLEELLKTRPDDLDELDTRYMPRHIRRICDDVVKDTKHMRFIVFYLTNEGRDGISENMDKVVNWFKEAYPSHQIDTLIVTSASGHTKEDIDLMGTEPTEEGKKGKIDLVFTCEKLADTYHSDLITGAVFDRRTRSFVKYMQMVGRVLSDTGKPAVIFDLVDNIHADFLGMEAPDARETLPEVPDGEPLTYDEVVALNPRAIHWEYVNRAAKTARCAEGYYRKQKKAERVARQAQEEVAAGGAVQARASVPDAGEAQADVPSSPLPSTLPALGPAPIPASLPPMKFSEAVKEAVRKAQDGSAAAACVRDAVPVKVGSADAPKAPGSKARSSAAQWLNEATEESLTFREALERCEELGVNEVTFEDVKAAEKERAAKAAERERRATRRKAEVRKSREAAEASEAVGETVQDNAGYVDDAIDLGYDAKNMEGWYWRINDCEQLSKNVRPVNRVVDFAKTVRDIVARLAAEDYEYVIRFASEKAGKKIRWKSYDEVPDKKSVEYKLMKMVVEMKLGIGIEPVIRYMVEGVAA